MKSLMLFGTVFALGLPALLPAASFSQTLLVHVPFAFMMAGQQFAPGDYRVEQSDNGLVLVHGEGKAAATLSFPAGIAKTGSTPGLKFVSSDNKEYLIGVEGETERTLTVSPQLDRKLILSSR